MPRVPPPTSASRNQRDGRMRNTCCQPINTNWMSIARSGPVDSDMKVMPTASSVFRSQPERKT